MTNKLDLESLWNAPASEKGIFQPDQLLTLPEAARRYLAHAIAPGTRLASAVRLQMRGEIKLQKWLPFTAEQVIRWDRGMIWTATAHKFGLPVRVTDRVVDGVGSMQVKLFGLLPIMRAAGPDITRSTLGRLLVESIGLPSALCRNDVIWSETDDLHPNACLTQNGENAELRLALEATGRIASASLSRWGNPEGAAFHYTDFGGILEEEAAFDGYTIPTRIRAGWYFGTERFESEGEFFRAKIVKAIYR